MAESIFRADIEKFYGSLRIYKTMPAALRMQFPARPIYLMIPQHEYYDDKGRTPTRYTQTAPFRQARGMPTM
eukprot:316412-Pyramimonas_sp.AAC.1